MSTTFHCQNCGSITDVSNMLRAFEDNPHCPQCGLSVSEIDAKTSDDLADLMARNLGFGVPQQPPQQLASTPPTPEVVPQAAPITYISQHYHHSAHIAPARFDEKPASIILLEAGINANALLPSQLQLFKDAQPDQRDRLIQLWSISPPSHSYQSPSQSRGNGSGTSLEQEELAARERYEHQEQEKLKNLSVLPGLSHPHAEPYMADAYESHNAQNYKPATDPVYAQSREWWQVNADEPMEHQYGMLQAIQMQYGSCQGMDRDQMMS